MRGSSLASTSLRKSSTLRSSEIARATVETAAAPSRMVLSADRTEIAGDRRDLAIVRVSSVDAQGRHVPTAANDIAFDVSGPGRIIGVGNGDPSSHEADTFPVTIYGQDLVGWRTAPFKGDKTRIPALSELDPAGGRSARVGGDAAGMAEESTSAFWTTFEVTAAQLAAGMTDLHLGQVDDEGRVVLNGTLVGTTNQ